MRQERRVTSVREKLLVVLRRRRSNVFLYADFAKLGSTAQLGRALRALVDAGKLVKLGVGVYARAKPSVVSGKPIPVRPVEVLAPQVLKKLGVKTYPSELVAAYNGAHSTQLPAGIVINTGNRRIARRLGFGRQFVRYENNSEPDLTR